MTQPVCETTNAARCVAIELTVRNHAGVMSHVCGLFSRRAFNLEAILVLPTQGTDQSRMWLLVRDNEKFEQVCSQLRKLHDVLELHVEAEGEKLFAALERQTAA